MENTKIFSKTLLKNQYLELENNNLEELIQKHESCIYSDSNLSNSIEELTSKIRDGKIGKNKFL